MLLVRELHELGELLATVDILEPEGQQAIGDAVFHLSTSTSARRTGSSQPRRPSLSGDEWDTAMDAWHGAHPGRRIIQG